MTTEPKPQETDTPEAPKGREVEGLIPKGEYRLAGGPDGEITFTASAKGTYKPKNDDERAALTAAGFREV